MPDRIFSVFGVVTRLTNATSLILPHFPEESSMPPRRPDPVTRETVFRTYRVPDELRDAIAAKRQSLKQTVRAFIADAIDSELQPLIQDLRKHLPFYPTGAGRPARLPLTDPLLARLKAASDETGGWLSVTHLFLAVLHQAAHRKRRRSGAGQ